MEKKEIMSNHCDKKILYNNCAKSSLFLNMIVALLLLSSYSQSQTIQNANLYSLISAIRSALPAEDSDAFVTPTTEQMEAFRNVIDLILEGQYSEATLQAEALTYTLYEWYDTGYNNHLYYVLMEMNANQPGGVQLGWGTYLFNPDESSEVIIEIPHPYFDTDTWKVGFLAYRFLNSQFLLMSGTHRYANGRSPRPADVAHNTQNIFHVVHKEVSPHGNHSLQFHGFSINKHPGYPNVILSNGSSNPPSIIDSIAAAIISQGYTVGIYDGINWAQLGATTNYQGQWSRSQGYSFIHMELQYFIRTTQSDWENIIDALYETFILPPVAHAAVITSIEDVPDDQGGWVKVHFDKSDWDSGSLLRSAEIYTVEMDDGSGWVAVNSTVAYGAETYSVLAHTTMDSSVAATGMVSFRVIAGMDEGTYVSAVMLGYSVDNLAPAMPAGLVASVTEENMVVLSWDSPVDEDFDGFRVYRSLVTDFDPTGMDPLAETIETTITDVEVEAGETYCYRVSAVDFNGNESDFSDDVSAEVLSLDEFAGIPDVFALRQNYPNPFNPVTTLRYDLQEQTWVRLTIYDVLGREVRLLVHQNQEPGYKSILWDAKDDFGKSIGAGVYLYRIEAGEFIQTNKMILLK